MSREVRQRIVLGILLPITAVVVGGALVFATSRLLLATPEDVTPFIALLLALNVLVGGALAAALRNRFAYALLTVVIVGTIIAGGVVGAVVGEHHVESLVEEEEPTPTPTGETPTGTPTGESPSPTDSPTGEVAATVDLTAEGIQFDTGTIELPAEALVAIRFDNRDSGTKHNFAVYTEHGGEAIFQGDIVTGPTQTDYEFTTPGPGTYHFQCDVHPTQMEGEVIVG